MKIPRFLALAASLVLGCATTHGATRPTAATATAPTPHVCYVPRTSLRLPSDREPYPGEVIDNAPTITALCDEAATAFDCRNGVAAGVLRLMRAAQIAHEELEAHRITTCSPELQRLIVLLLAVENLGPTQADQIPMPVAELRQLAVYATSPVCHVPGTPSISDILM